MNAHSIKDKQHFWDSATHRRPSVRPLGVHCGPGDAQTSLQWSGRSGGSPAGRKSDQTPSAERQILRRHKLLTFYSSRLQVRRDFGFEFRSPRIHVSPAPVVQGLLSLQQLLSMFTVTHLPPLHLKSVSFTQDQDVKGNRKELADNRSRRPAAGWWGDNFYHFKAKQSTAVSVWRRASIGPYCDLVLHMRPQPQSPPGPATGDWRGEMESKSALEHK